MGEEPLLDPALAAGSVLVTGGSRGIGAAVVRDLAAAGARVAFTWRAAQAEAAAVEETARASGGSASGWRCDSRDLEAVRRTVAEVSERLGPVRALVNNAGVTRDGLLVTMDPEAWHEVLDTDLTGVFHFCRAVAFGMAKARCGRIVNLGSVSGLVGNAGQVNYAAAKAGVVGLTRSLAKELARSGVTANVVAPGYIETDMTAGIPERKAEELRRAIPLRRFGTAAEVSGLVRFLLGPRAAYITGQVLTVDGGLSL